MGLEDREIVEARTPSSSPTPTTNTEPYKDFQERMADEQVEPGTGAAPAPTPSTSGYATGAGFSQGDWVFPVADTGAEYSNSFNVPRDNKLGIHGAIDIYAQRGAPIVSPVSGKVKNSGYSSVGGYWIQIQGDDGVVYYFAHLNGAPPSELKNGAVVSPGMPIGTVGNSGNASGTSPHLHFKMTSSSGTVINPYNFLQNGSSAYQNLTMGDDGVYTYEYGGGTTGGTATDAPVVLPTGGEFFTVGSTRYVAYSIKDPAGVGQAWMYFEIPSGIDAPAGTKLSASEWERKTGQEGWANAGSADAFRGVEAGSSWDDIIERTLMEMGIYGTDAMEDPGVLRVIAKFVADPTMGPTYLQSLLAQTDWYNAHTDRERSWNDKSEAQQAQDIVDQAMSLVGTWFTYVGEAIDVMQWDADGDGVLTADELKAGNPDLYARALGIANGTMTSREVVEAWIKPAAAETDFESPWQRVIRQEEQAQGQFETDVESSAAQVQQLYRDYGIPITWEEALKLGDAVEMNTQSLAEIEQGLDEQAMALYPGKPPGVKTITYANPYISAYKQLLEVPDVGLDDTTLQRAMTEGSTLGDFQTTLRKDPRWMKTANARDTYYQTLGQLGRTMGF
jgi:hypothetical protein